MISLSDWRANDLTTRMTAIDSESVRLHRVAGVAGSLGSCHKNGSGHIVRVLARKLAARNDLMSEHVGTRWAPLILATYSLDAEEQN